MPRPRTPAHDPRLDTITALIDDKKIMTLGDVFHFYPRTGAANYLSIDVVTFTRRLKDPESFSILQRNRLADLFKVSREKMEELLNRHIREVKKGDWQVPKLDYRGRGR